jgi:hypothetical protein
MSFIKDYLFDLEKQERGLWDTLEWLGVTGGAPFAAGLYWVIFALAVGKLPGWESVLLAAFGLVIVLFVLIQRAAFHRFITALRKEQGDAESALDSYMNQAPATDLLRAVRTSLGRLKGNLDRF